MQQAGRTAIDRLRPITYTLTIRDNISLKVRRNFCVRLCRISIAGEINGHNCNNLDISIAAEKRLTADIIRRRPQQTGNRAPGSFIPRPKRSEIGEAHGDHQKPA